MSAGFVYAIKFSSKRTKVGMTKDAGRRIEEHTRNARAHGIKVLDVWKMYVADPARAEVELMRLAVEQGGTPVYGNPEFFVRMDFEMFALIATELFGDHDTWADEMDARVVAALDRMDSQIREPHPSRVAG